jgi:hypothetical protein
LGPFSFTFKWLEPTDIKVTVGGVLKTAGTHYNLQSLNYTTKDGGQVLFTAGNAPANNATIRVYRDTDDNALSATFFSGSAIRAQDLNDNFTQNLYVTQEVNNNAVSIDGSNPMVGDLNMNGYQIGNLATPTASGDAATKDYVDAFTGNTGIPGHTRWRKLAGAGQTVFSGTGDYGDVLSYSPVREQVYLNGALQQRNADYSADNGTSVTFNVALQLNDVVDIVCTNNLVSGTVSNAANINYSGQFTDQTTRTVAAKLADVVSVKDFGAVGDGTTNDYVAILNALTAAAGRTVLLESGKTYRINQAINYSGNVDLKSDGINKATILHNGQSFTPLTIGSTTAAITTTLSASQQINNRGWDVTSATGVLPGMLMEVISSVSWYHDPRPESTDARKSELHRVAYVSGSTVYTEDPANDGYNVPTETVTVKFYSPISVKLENIAIRCVLPSPAVGAAAVAGIRINYADKPLLIDVDVDNAAAVGISITGCYSAVVDRGHTHSSNAFTTGYGVQMYGSSHSVVRNRSFWQCRRGVDVSGANVISRHTLIENCTNLGGGINSEGTVYGWTEDSTTGAPQFGFGSHGPADHTIYRGNRVAQMHTPFNVRGRNEIIENNYIIGRTRFGAIIATYGENLWVLNNKVYSGWTALKNSTIYEGGGNINTRRADWFLRFTSSHQGGEIVVKDNDVQIQNRFINFESGAVQNNVTLEQNKVRFATQSGTDIAYLAYNEGSSVTVSSWRIFNNDYSRVGGTAATERFYNLVITESSQLAEGNLYTGFYTPTITNGSNVASSTIAVNRYTRTGNQVFVMGSLSITATAGLTNTNAQISLPFASSFTSTTEARLTGTSYTLGRADVISGQADVTNDTILLRWYPSASGAVVFNYVFMYEVV